MVVRLLGLGTALPGTSVASDQVSHFLGAVGLAAGAAPSFPTRLQRLIRVSGVERRHSVLRDYEQKDPANFEFFPKRWDLEPFPTTADRMKVYEAEVVPLAAVAARKALAEAQLAPQQVTHLVFTSCTGFFAPGPDVGLVQALGLSPNVERTLVGFMGCSAGITGMRLAERLVRADPQAVVLEVAAELSTLHIQREVELRRALPNLLFGDGAGAAVWGAAGPGRGRYLSGACRLAPETQASMRWQIGDHGFVMHLGAEVPDLVGEATLPFVASLLEPHGLSRDQVAGWAIHPGGKRIVEAVGEALGLPEAALGPSLDTLRDVGNVSSATIFFVLERLRGRPGPVVALAFGPGLTLEGAVLSLG